MSFYHKQGEKSLVANFVKVQFFPLEVGGDGVAESGDIKVGRRGSLTIYSISEVTARHFSSL